MIRRAMFYLNKNKPSVFEIAASCVQLCLDKGIEPIFFEEDRGDIEQHIPACAGCRYLSALDPARVDVIFIFGGDGTVLRALDLYLNAGLPVLGINLGRLGFLLETEVGELSQALDMLRAGEYDIERRMMLQLEAQCGDETLRAHATNEVCISRGMSQRMIAVDAYAGKTLVDHYIADGLVLASPTGSTAYSLSAGGPIVTPGVSCFVLTPVCPHSLQSRPIILSPDERITLRVDMKEAREGIQLSVDGQALCGMSNGDYVVVCRAPHDALLIRFPKERNFFALLKDKLSQWSL
ncbi:MAG: NAD(+)/NADH kinase [Clostridia bacterium]|nr:NAD(+)/NADH kinase [Clostridia bacterium]